MKGNAMGKITPIDRMTQGYAGGRAPDDRRRRKIAAVFRADPKAERVLELKRRDPAAYARLDNVTRTGAAMYEQAKRIVEGDDHGNNDEAA